MAWWLDEAGRMARASVTLPCGRRSVDRPEPAVELEVEQDEEAQV